MKKPISKKDRFIFIALSMILIFSIISFILRDALLVNAVESGSVALTKLALITGANPNVWDDGNPLLYWAAVDGNNTEVNLLINKGAKVNIGGEQGETPLMAAVRNGNNSTVELLVSKGAVVRLMNAQKETAINIAVTSKHTDLLKLLR